MVKKVVLSIVAVVALLVVVVVGLAAMQPSEYSVERSTTIAAPPAEVFPHVNDFRKWEAWSPWAKLDPDAKVTFEGPESGADAVMKWSGDEKVGEGSMKITESRPSDLIRIQLDFIKPFEDTAAVEFAFEPKGDDTLVNWRMSGRNNFVGKIFCLFMNMDEMIGADYEKGLASMKSIVESKSASSEPK